jgi:hypothetical protein
MAGEASRRNGAKGGRPKGRKDTQTIEREAVLKAYRERVCQQAQRLLDAEMTVAQGCSFLYKKPKESKKGEARKSERVTNPETIRAFLDGELEDDADEFFYIVTERPDTLTIRNMLDRTFDKPAQRVEMTDGEGNAVPMAVTFVIQQQPGAVNRT